MATTGPKPFGTATQQWTWDRLQRRERAKNARRHDMKELDRFMAEQRQRVKLQLRSMSTRIQHARRRHGNEDYSDEVVVTRKGL